MEKSTGTIWRFFGETPFVKVADPSRPVELLCDKKSTESPQRPCELLGPFWKFWRFVDFYKMAAAIDSSEEEDGPNRDEDERGRALKSGVVLSLLLLMMMPS